MLIKNYNQHPVFYRKAYEFIEKLTLTFYSQMEFGLNSMNTG